jgi:hypothetical protein
LQGLEYQFQSLNQISAAMQSLANEAVEYSRRNPAMETVLHQFEQKPRPGAPTGAAPPTLQDAR